MQQSTYSLWDREPSAEASLRTMEQNYPDRTNSEHARFLSEKFALPFTKDMVQKRRKKWRRAAREASEVSVPPTSYLRRIAGSIVMPAPAEDPVAAQSIPEAGDDFGVKRHQGTVPHIPHLDAYTIDGTPLGRFAHEKVSAEPAVAAHDNPGGIQMIPFGPGDVAAVYNDVHVPHQDDKALSIVHAILRDLRPTHLIDAGDFLDFARLGRFPNHPQTPDVDRELALGRAEKVKMEQAAGPQVRAKIKLSGNHEDRYRRYLWDMAKSLPASMVRGLHEPECLDLAGWQVYGYRQELDLAGVRIAHGNIVRKIAGWSGRAEFDIRLCSGVSGHVHRAAIYRKTAGGRAYFWVENGCLCRKDLPYVGSGGNDWQTAITVLRHDGRNVQPEQVVIHDYVAYFGGRKYTAGS